MKELEWPFDCALLLRKQKEFRKQLHASRDSGEYQQVKIALLGGSTTAIIKDMLDLFLLNNGISAHFYESGYNRFYEEGVFSCPALDAFMPDITVICTSTHNIQAWPELADSEADAARKLDEEYRRFETIWESLASRFACCVIQANMEIPAQRVLGSMDAWDFRGRVHFAGNLNQLFYRYAASHSNFYIHDVHTLSAEFGLDKWHDMRQWNLYKCACAMEAVPVYAYQLASIITAVRGKGRKAIVLDADNTLWGGVIGDLGPEGIALGQESAKGQAFMEWQQYLKRLKDRGLLLLLVSKNEKKSVLAGLSHPNSVLKADDFAAMEVNWENKVSNIQLLAQRINISPDQMIFIDDNPAERALVRESIAGLAVLDAASPDAFMRALQEGHYLEPAGLSGEDTERTRMYLENARRSESQKQFGDYNAFLQSLRMKASIAPFEKFDYARICQLANKTNQFNLTGRRFSPAEIEQLALNPDWICLSGKLTDRFGDNGIVSLLFAECQGETARIYNFLMSCRVFGRGMEYAMMDSFVERCKTKGISRIEGEYIPTAKNMPVKDLYKKMGFSPKHGENGGQTFWVLEANGYMPQKNYIEVR